MNYVIPEKINNFNVYNDGNKLIGISDEVTLPEINEVTSEVSGPGILGPIESPTTGIFENMELEVPFRTLYESTFDLMQALTSIGLTFRGAVQVTDGEGNISMKGMRVVVRGRKKSFVPGKLKQGEGTGSSVKLALTYYMVELDGKSRIEIDKLNSIYRINGVDMLAAVRALC
ncbi:MAG: phage major tail tube protein [Clostridiaceae bacterium]|nr:phage major tail tube protein [Clostridiaceae bacterium]